MTKTITLKKINEKEEYILYSGKDKKRKTGLFGIYGDKIYFPRKKESLPIITLRVEKDNNLVVVYGYYVLKKYEPIFGETYKNEGNKEQPLINGSQLKRAHNYLQILNMSNKIPYTPVYIGGGLFGDSKCLGIKIEQTAYNCISDFIMNKPDSSHHSIWANSELSNNNSRDYFQYINKKFNITKTNLDKILNNYDFPSDDNNKEIKENELVKIILKS